MIDDDQVHLLGASSPDETAEVDGPPVPQESSEGGALDCIEEDAGSSPAPEDEQIENSVELALLDDPIDRLTPNQVNAALRMVNFPNATVQSIADHVGVSRQTIYNWKKDPDFQAVMAGVKRELVNKTVQVRAHRNAHIFDRLAEELFDRLEKPETDEVKLKEILGENYTQEQLYRYQNRFATNLSMKDILTFYGQAEDRMRKDEIMNGSGEDEHSLFERIQIAYERTLIIKRKRLDFQSQSGFTYDTDFNEEDSVEVFAKNAGEGGAEEEVIDAEFVEAEEEEVDFLTMFTVE